MRAFRLKTSKNLTPKRFSMVRPTIATIPITQSCLPPVPHQFEDGGEEFQRKGAHKGQLIDDILLAHQAHGR